MWLPQSPVSGQAASESRRGVGDLGVHPDLLPCAWCRAAVLGVMKIRLVGATKGHALLKKKADALTMRFRYDLHFVCAPRPPATPAACHIRVLGML